jgi:tetratricopeptide (TPR) repeat protein
MHEVRRFLAIGVFLGLMAILTCSHLWGDAPRQDPLHSNSGLIVPATGMDRSIFEQGSQKFADHPLITYRTADGETLFALQLQPKLEPGAPRPRDYLILVSTAASMGKGELILAQKLTELLVASAKPGDRFAIRTVNVQSHELTNGFQPADQLHNALQDLRKELPFGAADLKSALEQSVKSLEKRQDRQQVLLFLGDGKSIINPISSEDRARLSKELVAREVAFYPVPLGLNVDPQNLHGFATATGGAPVRVVVSDKLEDTVQALNQTIAAPILYPTKVERPVEVTEAFPEGQLPPLRSDVPSLLVGRMKPAAALTFVIQGVVAGKPIRVEQKQAVPEPEMDNFFLTSMVGQWRNAKDRPALLRADRTLAFAFQQNQLARQDLIARAELALAEDKFEVALGLFLQAQELDPTSVEAKAGVQVVQKLKNGQLTKKDLERELRKPGDKVLRLDADGGKRLIALNQAPVQPPPAPAPPGPAEAGQLLQDVRQRQALEDQRTSQLVEQAVRQARREMQTDPEGAREGLKRTLDSLLTNPDLSPRTRAELSQRGETALRDIEIQGARIQRDIEERLRRYAQSLERLRLTNDKAIEEERIIERMRVFHNLMNQARDDLAMEQAQNLRQDLINSGKAVPPAVNGGYTMALFGHNALELENLNRVRRERYLLTMMQVERSNVPFPDEPPIQFPPIPQWKMITELRKEKYESTSLGGDTPPETYRLRNELNKTVDFDGLDDTRATLLDALQLLQSRYKINFDVNEAAFKAEGLDDVLSQPVATKPIPKMTGVSLATVLRKILSRITTQSGATYLIRRDVIEITTGEFQRAEKVVRVYPVLDLVIPPSTPPGLPITSFFTGGGVFGFGNQIGFAGIGGLLGGFGGLAGIGGFPGGFGGGFGQFGGGLGALGGGFGQFGGGLGALGGGFGQFGGGLGALGGGGFGQFGGGLGALGGGFGQFGGGLGALGGGFGQFGGGLGIGGGLGALGGGGFGIGGGLGALGGGGFGVAGGFGQLGGGGFGQFGAGLGQAGIGGQLGGPNQSQLLVLLIRQVIGTAKDWAPLGGINLQPRGPGGVPMPPPEDENPNAKEGGNDLGYYPAVGALVVKGTSRIHTRASAPPVVGAQGLNPPPLARADDPKPGHVVITQNGVRTSPANGQVAAAGNRATDAEKKLKEMLPEGITSLDAKVVWQEALAKGVDDPGLIIACADYLALNNKFDHAAEFLKADLSQGIVVKPWVYDSLAVALRQSHASPEEIERAEVSATDLQPLDAKGFLKAAQAMRDLKRYDRALAFCRQAALLEPEVPDAYREGLVCAEEGKDSQAMIWAAGNLLRRDWPLDNKELQTKASTRLEALARVLEKDNRKLDVEEMRQAISKRRQRDVVIRLNWQGQADLDLKVEEPTGSICSCLNRQTVGGGTLIGDTLSETNSETYVSAEAFPGEYKITVARCWGKPLGDKAQVVITLHQGTPQERTQIETVDLKVGNTVTVKLDNGRRKNAAVVPPPGSLKRQTVKLETGADRVFNQLRDMADPTVTVTEGGLRAGLSAFGAALSRDVRPITARPEKDPGDHLIFQNKVGSMVSSSMDFTARAVLSGDGSRLRLSMSPVSGSISAVPPVPVVTTPVIPGADMSP